MMRGQPQHIGVEYRQGSDTWVETTEDGWVVRSWGLEMVYTDADDLLDGLLLLARGEVDFTHGGVIAIVD